MSYQSKYDNPTHGDLEYILINVASALHFTLVHDHAKNYPFYSIVGINAGHAWNRLPVNIKDKFSPIQELAEKIHNKEAHLYIAENPNFNKNPRLNSGIVEEKDEDDVLEDEINKLIDRYKSKSQVVFPYTSGTLKADLIGLDISKKRYVSICYNLGIRYFGALIDRRMKITQKDLPKDCFIKNPSEATS